LPHTFNSECPLFFSSVVILGIHLASSDLLSHMAVLNQRLFVLLLT
jgi:hypothetical protein